MLKKKKFLPGSGASGRRSLNSISSLPIYLFIISFLFKNCLAGFELPKAYNECNIMTPFHLNKENPETALLGSQI